MSMQMLLQDFLISERQPLISIINYALSYTPDITRQRDFLILTSFIYSMHKVNYKRNF